MTKNDKNDKSDKNDLNILESKRTMMRQFLTLIKHSELVALYGNTFFKTVFKNHRITSQTSFQRF